MTRRIGRLERVGPSASVVAARLAWAALVAWAVVVAFGADRAWQGRIVEICTYVVLATMWNLLAGYAGLVSIGQQAYVGLGVYALVVLANGAGLQLYAAIVPAALLAALLAVPIGLVAFRLRGGYFAIGTWVIAEVVRLVVKNNTSAVIGGGTGTSIKVAESFKESRYSVVALIAIVVAVLAVVTAYVLLRTRLGLHLQAARDSESGAASLGVDVARVRFVVYVIAAGFTALASATYFVKGLNVQPDAAFSVGSWTAPIVVIVVVGGAGTLEGPVVGALAYYLVREFVRDRDWVSDTTFLILTGVCAILFSLYAKDGLWGWVLRRAPRLSALPVRREVRVRDDAA